ncbi:MAG TPA: enolase C-terminal domain-like protein [Chloroflexota bacterium]|nr:enolase C-terminal domain-like protein [Chloroflexota bacterium]
MRIVRADVFYVAVPYIPAIRKYRPDEHTERPVPVVKLTTDEGLVGWGEGARGQKVPAERLAQWLGLDPLEIEWAAAGVPFEPALFDLAGKALGLPAHKLIGPKVRDRIPVGYWSCHMDPQDTALEAAQAARRGFKHHKLKARPWDIVEQARAIGDAAGPDYQITVDPNFAFETLDQSLRLADALAPYPIAVFEDPFSWKPDFDGYPEFRRRSAIPLAPHMGRPEDVLKAVTLGAADFFNLDGCIARARHMAGIAEAAGLRVWLQTAGLALGVRSAYGVHVAAVIPNATEHSDLHFVKEHDLLRDSPIDPQNGEISVPSAPGLGVEVDESALARYCVGALTAEP